MEAFYHLAAFQHVKGSGRDSVASLSAQLRVRGVVGVVARQGNVGKTPMRSGDAPSAMQVLHEMAVTGPMRAGRARRKCGKVMEYRETDVLRDATATFRVPRASSRRAQGESSGKVRLTPWRREVGARKEKR